MPRYTFVAENGDIIDLQMSMAEHAKRVKNDTIKLPDGRIAKTDWSAYSFISTVPANYPMESDAMGVHPSQIKEHMEHLRKMGCGQVDHTPEGAVILRDKSQRRQVAHALGLFDRNSGYSDPAPIHRTAPVRRFR